MRATAAIHPICGPRNALACTIVVALLFVVVGLGCAPSTTNVDTKAPASSSPTSSTTELAPESILGEAEAALDRGDPARAVALYGRVLTADPTTENLRVVYLGLARAHEQLGDCRAAVRAYDAYLDQFATDTRTPSVYARRGACEAEIGAWERSAESYVQAQRVAEHAAASDRVEWLARQGYALFQLERFDKADARLAEADAIHAEVTATSSERFSTYYFVGMARFYRAAIIHRRFRAVNIRAGRKEMERDYETKLELLLAAQDAYKHVVKLKHVFWVSAAGYQWGSMFTEFYDSLMYAPVPDWLDTEQRKIYFEELKTQIRPIMNDAIWVYEKNLEVSRKLGYENRFVEQSRAQLDALQQLLRQGDDRLGQPHPRLAPDEDTRQTEPSALFPGADPRDLEHKLFVPPMTPL